MEMPHSSLYNLLVEGRYQDYEKNKMADLVQEYLEKNLTNDVN